MKNQICIDSEIDNFEKCSEIDLLLRHINYVKEGDLLLLDRFYPSIWLFYLLNAKKIDFCIRMKTNWWLLKEDNRLIKENNRLIKEDNRLIKEDNRLIKHFGRCKQCGFHRKQHCL